MVLGRELFQTGMGFFAEGKALFGFDNGDGAVSQRFRDFKAVSVSERVRGRGLDKQKRVFKFREGKRFF